MALLTALLDANILYPAGLRDVFLRLADQYLYAPLWSADIHAEWIRSVLADRPDLTEGMLERTRMVMDRHFPEAVVTGYTARAAGLDLPDPDDIHVLAAAIEGEADMIVTRNLRDFPADRLAPHGLTAQHPDAFIARLFDADPRGGACGRPRSSGGPAESTANRERTPDRTRTPGSCPNGIARPTAPGFHLIGTATNVHAELAFRQVPLGVRDG